MSDYTDKVCPYCRTAFTPEDDVVLCSACEMPHHKDCWIENQGCTTFGCLGTIQGVNNVAPFATVAPTQYAPQGAVVAGVIFCAKCGTRNDSIYSFCGRCGSRLVTSAPAPQPVYQQQPVYPQQAAHPVQPAYPQQAAYPVQPAYPQQAVYPVQPAYPQRPVYPVQPAQPSYAPAEEDVVIDIITD